MPWWPPACAAVLTLAVTLWKIQVPSFWRDEGATQAATQRSFTDLITMLGHVDAVHGAYYVVMWLEVRLAGHGELALRLPSALAMAATAALIMVTGRRLVSQRAGLAAGLTFAALPAVSWFAQDARPFALETAAAAAASYVLVRLAEDGARHWACWYAACLVALGLADVFGLLLIPAHAAALALWQPPGRRRAVARRWGQAVAIACVALLPLMAAAWAQRAQVGWLRPPGVSAALATGRLVGSAALLLAAAVLTGTGLAHAALGRRLGSDWPLRLPALCLPWLAGPPVILFVMSQFQPAYTFRYIMFCAPAAALLIGTSLAAAGRVATAAGLALLMLLALPAQLGERGPAGHADNIRSLDQIVARYEQPGDAVLYPQGAGTRAFAAAYPFGLAGLRDVMLGESAGRSDTIAGTDAPPQVVRGRLAGVRRVWVIENNVPAPRPPAELSGLPFRLAHDWHVSVSWLGLYEFRA